MNKANAADVRVYELLEQKFNLFSGVFGASDEVLGSIESGLDFEKRIASIYQNCRTYDQIAEAFNNLQAELESSISDSLNKTRQNLLENFDEEVHEKLRINLQESKEYLSKYEAWLWAMTKYYLGDDAEFANDEHSFSLRRNPFEGELIHPGPYRIGKNVAEANVYRINHPLAQRIIEKCKRLTLPLKELSFNYSTSGLKISILSPLIGKSGWLLAKRLSVVTFDTEDHVILSSRTDDGIELDNEQCARLFSVYAEEVDSDLVLEREFESQLESVYERKKTEIVEDINTKNVVYFDLEIEKLDKWGEDRRNSLKLTLKELDEEIRTLKKQARLAPNVPEKLKLEKERRTLETRRDEAWKEYDGAAKEIDQTKDKLLDQIEKKLEQNIDEEILFLIRWKLN